MNQKLHSLQHFNYVEDATSKEIKTVVSEEHSQYALQITRWQLKLLGIWSLSSKSSLFEKIVINIIIVICLFLILFILVPGCLFIYIKVKDINMRIQLIGPLSFFVMAIMKYSSLLSKRKYIDNCINHIVLDWKNITSVDDRNIMMDYANYGRLGSIICAIFMYGGGIFFSIILPLVSPSSQNEQNITIKSFAYPSYYVWLEPQDNVTYIIIFCLQSCSAIVTLIITSSACSIAVVYVMHACGQLNIVISPFKDLLSESSDCQRVNAVLPNVIQHHINILRFIGNIKKILNNICLVEVGGCTLNICFLGYYFMLGWKESDIIGIMTYMILLLSLTFNIFLFCYIGDCLTNECRKVGDSIYTINWYKVLGKNSRQLILILIIAQNPVIITAGNIIDLTLVNFCTIIRTSIAYLNFLRQFME